MSQANLERPASELDIYGFVLDASRAARQDLGVRLGLADSLRTVFDSLDRPVDGARYRLLLEAIEARPVEPALFGTYVELVLALFDERDADAMALIEVLLGRPPTPAGPLRIVALDDGELGPGQADRYRRLMSDEVMISIDPASPAARAGATAALEAALDLLRRGALEVFEEIQGLIREIVLVSGQCYSDRLVVGGAVSFSLWGAQVLVAEQVGDRLAMALHLAHEASHAHLFGLAAGGRLVENDDALLYPSPLRPDPRPMKGVAHATDAGARGLCAARPRRVGPAYRAGTPPGARADRRGFVDGMATLSADGRFTPAGCAAFEYARGYMDCLDLPMALRIPKAEEAITDLNFGWAECMPEKPALVVNGHPHGYGALAGLIAEARGFFARRGDVGAGWRLWPSQIFWLSGSPAWPCAAST